MMNDCLVFVMEGKKLAGFGKGRVHAPVCCSDSDNRAQERELIYLARLEQSRAEQAE